LFANADRVGTLLRSFAHPTKKEKPPPETGSGLKS
jgi:hypothetical protein